ncbi:MAG: DNA polymerase I [Deltaproteobacteria bacterium]|jgi:DNA polymerase-1|nr:DNA polymerase I [Deltaproteobacteria bacterium]MBW2535852.1 DNA polymerase I [Deltaproteobacteria bacterium]
MSELPSELPAPGADDVLYLVDLSGYVFRAYFALPPLTSAEGEPTGATYGTVTMLSKLIADRKPALLAVAMDSPGKGFRAEIDPSYKANRPPAPPDLPPQITRCREIVEAWSIPVFIHPALEADDLIATLTRKARAAGLRVVIASSDKDLMQLVEPDAVWLWDAMRNRVFGPTEVRAKLGVGPAQVQEYLALVGDSSDNVKGVPGVGPKTAAKLLGQFGSVFALFDRLDEVTRPKLRTSLGDSREAVELALKLVALADDRELDFDPETLRFGGADVAAVRALYEELGFARLVESLDAGPAANGPEPATGTAPAAEGPAVVLERAALKKLCAAARESGHLAVVAFGTSGEPMRAALAGIALGAGEPPEVAYLPVGHRYLGVPRQLTLDEVRATLGPLLSDPTVAKVGHDLKYTAVLLAQLDLPLAGARFDSMLASYLLDPESSHDLGRLAELDTDVAWIPYGTIAPKERGKPQATLDELSIDKAAPFAASHSAAVLQLRDRYAPLLDGEGLTGLERDLELPLLEVLVTMERTGVKLSPEPLAALSRQMTDELADLEQQAHEAAGHSFNVASPKQLETILFDELGLKSTRKTKTGRSTDATALEAVADAHPLPRLVLEHRAIAKLKGTYVDTLPGLIHPQTGRIHTRWDQAVAATGRLASKDPNLQNIPIRTAHGKRIREAFTAPEGKLLLSADYSQIELRVLAHLSQDPVLLEAFQSGEDIHKRTAMEVFGVDASGVTETMRRQSKTINFGIIYGMGSTALAKRLGIPRKQAKQFIEAYFERYRGVQQFMERTLAEAQQTQSVRTLLGRRRILSEIDSSHHARRAYAERIAQNTPIQGTAADLLKLAMVKLAEPVVPGARMVLTVHDELVFEVPADQLERATARTKQAMESVYDLDVPLTVDVGSGPNWAVAH